eukprot:CAMPEP_0119060678 /NCGR_PEP_ID=MMETSP1178-20130426/4617_1 /TAXON_ID=33656 /ORGANISM="unid sp, Strain CCMP2000" /LENGTH=183 /DNA_ID=CAMNT_0007041807 /DNA_START=44 /DNA_END=595 /DNA_ORIENTATION=-
MLVAYLSSLALCLHHDGSPRLRTIQTARVRPTVAVIHELPPGFDTLMPQVVHHTPFSRHLFNAIMGYMAVDTTVFAARIVKRRIQPGVHEAARLAAAPPTKFGWVQADLRGPLPPLDDLDRLRVGLRDGHTLHLCRANQAITFASIERSLDFSEHYGEPVYICSMAPPAQLKGGKSGPGSAAL